jgi:hypothetical protein
MATTYAWTISALDVEKEVEGLQDVVVTVHWRLRATDDLDGLSAEVYGADSLPLPAADGFVSFEQFTEEQLIGWLEASFVTTTERPNPDDPEGEPLVSTDDRLQFLKGQLAASILEKRQPKMVTLAPPWASTAQPVVEEPVVEEPVVEEPGVEEPTPEA